ncbi:MAG: hypothetical protein AAGM46_27995, partial [Cyanobacteria bacterium J06582_2]
MLIYIGKGKKEKEEFKVYNEDGEELNEQEIKREVPKYWREYLGKGKNEINKVWNKEQSKKFKEKWEEEIKYEPGFVILPGGVFKVGRPEQEITPMKLKAIVKETMRGKLENLKNKK